MMRESYDWFLAHRGEEVRGDPRTASRSGKGCCGCSSSCREHAREHFSAAAAAAAAGVDEELAAFAA
jgi:hypothetical protein